MDTAAGDNPRRLDFRVAEFFGFNSVFAVNRLTQSVNNTPQQFLADRNAHDFIGAFNLVAFFNRFVGTENNHADIVFFQIKSHPFNAGFKFDHFIGLNFIQTVNTGNTVADGQHLSDFGNI